MKKLIILVFLFISLTVVANNNTLKKHYVSNSVQKSQIIRLLSEINLTKSNTVRIKLSINSNNIIEIDTVICKDLELRDQIYSLINHQKIAGNNVEVENINLQINLVPKEEEQYCIY